MKFEKNHYYLDTLTHKVLMYEEHHLGFYIFTEVDTQETFIYDESEIFSLRSY